MYSIPTFSISVVDMDLFRFMGGYEVNMFLAHLRLALFP